MKLHLALLAAFACAGAASAESSLRFEPPPAFGVTNAAVLDPSGQRVGAARFEIASIADGRIQLRTHTRLDTGAGSDTEALLAPADPSGRLRLVSEHAKTFAAGGALAIDSSIDHVAGRVECAGAASEGGALALAADERVANVPIQLVLRPIATGALEELEMEMAMCRGKPRLMTLRAARKDAAAWPARAKVVEIELGPSGWLGALAGLAGQRASFWFDAGDGARWLAHRVPLEPGGPPLIVVREGVKLAPSLLGAEQ